jgi:hypothetical protein
MLEALLDEEVGDRNETALRGAVFIALGRTSNG